VAVGVSSTTDNFATAPTNFLAKSPAVEAKPLGPQARPTPPKQVPAVGVSPTNHINFPPTTPPPVATTPLRQQPAVGVIVPAVAVAPPKPLPVGVGISPAAPANNNSAAALINSLFLTTPPIATPPFPTASCSETPGRLDVLLGNGRDCFYPGREQHPGNLHLRDLLNWHAVLQLVGSTTRNLTAPLSIW